jgi:hypothetical protein
MLIVQLSIYIQRTRNYQGHDDLGCNYSKNLTRWVFEDDKP